VVSALLAEEIDFCLEGLPEPFKGWDSTEDVILPNGITMRDYQVESLRKTLKWYRGIWKIATNGGKTAQAAGLMSLLGENKRYLIMVPRKVILSQFVSELKTKLMIKKVGVAGSGKFELLNEGITVAMYQTLSRRLKSKAVKTWLQGVDVLMVDECHFAVAETFKKVIMKCPAQFRIGMSGTPFHEEKHRTMEIRSLFGPVLTKVSNKTLIDKGVSIKPHVIFLDVATPKLSSKIVWQDAYTEGIVNNKNRNRVISQLAKGFLESGRQTVIMVQRVNHLERLHKIMPWATAVHANSPDREAVLERLAKGEVFCLICTAIFDTGLSVDYIEAIINASGGKSSNVVLQRIGRALRSAKDMEKDVWIVDFLDNHHRDLRRHGNDRLKTVVNEDAFDVTEFLKDMPEEVQNSLSPALLNSSHYDIPILDV
jgi:superfamily II DNA or RNA helicase